jgi:hypothetical protein
MLYFDGSYLGMPEQKFGETVTMVIF